MKETLRHPDAEERRKALAALSSGEIAHLLPELGALLDDADWRVRREAAHAFARMKDPAPALPLLLDAVETGDVARRNAGIEALRLIGPSIAPAVLARLAHARGSARRFLIEVLAAAGNDVCVEPLTTLLDDADPNVPPAATEALGSIPGAAARNALTRALGHRDPVVRLAALQAFAARDESIAWDQLGPLLRDQLCRRAALRAAANCPDPRALAAIAAALSDANATLSSEAAVACAAAARRGRREEARAALLERTGAARVLRHLGEHGASAEVRRAAIECLGLVADPPSVVAVLRATDSPETSAAAHESLDHFGREAVPHALGAASGLGEKATAALLRWALPRAPDADRPDLVRIAWHALDAGDGGAAAWDVVAGVGDRADAERLVDRLATRSDSVEPREHARPVSTILRRHPEIASRIAAAAPPHSLLGLMLAELLAVAGHPVAVDALREALTDPEPQVRAAAVRALAASGQVAARDALEFALADESPAVQAAAAEALGSLGGGDDVLVESVRAADPRVRRAAARALARRGGRVRNALLPLLDDPEPAVVLAALEGIGSEATAEDLAGLTTHRDPDIAAEALARLREVDVAAAAGAAEKLLDHPAWAVRLEGVRALTGSPRGRELLAGRRDRERDDLVREAIERALRAVEAGGGRAGE